MVVKYHRRPNESASKTQDSPKADAFPFLSVYRKRFRSDHCGIAKLNLQYGGSL
jgi:hypothetical protein